MTKKCHEHNKKKENDKKNNNNKTKPPPQQKQQPRNNKQNYHQTTSPNMDMDIAQATLARTRGCSSAKSVWRHPSTRVAVDARVVNVEITILGSQLLCGLSLPSCKNSKFQVFWRIWRSLWIVGPFFFLKENGKSQGKSLNVQLRK